MEIMKIYYGDLLRERGGDIMIKMKIDVFLMCNDNNDNRCGWNWICIIFIVVNIKYFRVRLFGYYYYFFFFSSTEILILKWRILNQTIDSPNKWAHYRAKNLANRSNWYPPCARKKLSLKRDRNSEKWKAWSGGINFIIN